MIISASRRTDIPAFYSDWLFNRLREGSVLVRNPMNPHQVSKVSLKPDVVDGLVLWTKNPAPMLGRLDELRDYTYYFQYTLNAYGRDVEPGVPPKDTQGIPTFLELARQIGPERVIWRYDPILFTARYTPEYHERSFGEIARRLRGATLRCTFSFLDDYKKTKKRTEALGVLLLEPEQMRRLTVRLSGIAAQNGMELVTCCEPILLGEPDIGQAPCIDARLLEKLSGIKLKVPKEQNQRVGCICAASIDIGAYETCPHGCAYCYATANPRTAARRYTLHDPASPLLFGALTQEDVVTERKAASFAQRQTFL